MMRRRRGYLLLETMVAIGILVVAGSMAVGIAHWSLKYLHSTQIAESRTAALDQAVAQLRNDVWCAESMHSVDPQSLMIETSGTQITWQLGSDSIIRRIEAGQVRSWEVAASGATLSLDGALVRLFFPDTAEWRGGTISMTSESMQLGASRP